MAISAKRLVLDLLATAPDAGLSAQAFIQAGDLFDLTSNNVRVALARLKNSELIRPGGRGIYRIGPAGEALRDEWGAWRKRAAQCRPWRGGWIGVAVGGLGRQDRTAVRRRDRATSLVGLRPLTDGLLVRPDNLGGLESIARRLHRLGLEAHAPVFSIAKLAPRDDEAARALWSRKDLSTHYSKGLDELSKSVKRLGSLTLADAARESFLAGGAAIKKVLFDPLLPEPLGPLDDRSAFFDAVLDYDAGGRRIWDQLVLVALGRAA